jgi:serine/threonine protein kinase
MPFTHVPCGSPVNQSEEIAIQQVKSLLGSMAGEHWIGFTNFALLTTHQRQPDDLDIVCIGPRGVILQEVKHWDGGAFTGLTERAEHETRKLKSKAERLAGLIRQSVRGIQVEVRQWFVLTREGAGTTKPPTDFGGAKVFTLNGLKKGLAEFQGGRLSPSEVDAIRHALEPRSRIQTDGKIRRLADFENLELNSPAEQRFHRTYRGVHRRTREKVIVHLYDLSASEEKDPRRIAEREFRVLQVLQKSHFVPRFRDSLQELPDYPGEIWFFTVFDPDAPTVEKRASDQTWNFEQRLDFARQTLRALKDIHGLTDEQQVAIVHRNLSPNALLVGDYMPTIADAPDRGYVFCPDFISPNGQPEKIGESWDGQCSLWLFGPDSMLAGVASEQQANPTAAPIPAVDTPPPTPIASSSVPESKPQAAATDSPTPPATAPATAKILIGKSKSGEEVSWTTSIRSNPHLMIVGQPGMGKTTCLISLCAQLQRSGITPIVFSYHEDIDERMAALFPDVVAHDCTRLGFNPMRVSQPGPLAHIESAGQLRDIFHAIYSDLGELQLEQLRSALKKSYEEAGWGGSDGNPLPPPVFRRFVEILRESGGKDQRTQTLLARLTELDDFRFFDVRDEQTSLLSVSQPQMIRIHSVSNEAMQRACAGFVLYRIYQDMFTRGTQERLTHAIVFDEAHRAGRLKLLPTMAKECRKYGLSLIVASQEARDFDTGLFGAIGNYLVLRVTDNDARIMSKNAAGSELQRNIADRLKALPKYEAIFFSEHLPKPIQTRLRSEAA